MSHVFISYKHQDFVDSSFLDTLEQKLTTATVTIWRDINIEAGENWETVIDEAISDCFALVLLLSENVNDSQYVTYEWTRALTLNKTIIPVRLSSKTIIHPRLEKIQFIDLTQNEDRAWDWLVASLQTLQDSYEDTQKRLEESNVRENQRIYTILKDLYEARFTKVTTDDLIVELRLQNFLSLADYAHLIDLSRKNQSSSE